MSEETVKPKTLLKVIRKEHPNFPGRYLNVFELNGNPVEINAIAARELSAVKKPIMLQVFEINIPFEVDTLEGRMDSMPEGGYLIIGVRGEGYACKKDIFKETYDVYKKN